MATLKEMNAEEARQRLREAREECFRNIAARDREREKEMIRNKLTVPGAARTRFVHVFSQLLVCPVDNWIKKPDLANKFNLDPATIQKDMRLFYNFDLINRSNRGYQPTPKFFQLAEHLQQEEPEIYAILKKG
jgi:hypothetical protein